MCCFTSERHDAREEESTPFSHSHSNRTMCLFVYITVCVCCIPGTTTTKGSWIMCLFALRIQQCVCCCIPGTAITCQAGRVPVQSAASEGLRVPQPGRRLVFCLTVWRAGGVKMPRLQEGGPLLLLELKPRAPESPNNRFPDSPTTVPGNPFRRR